VCCSVMPSGAQVDLSAAWLAPGAPFGQVVAAAFDRAMSPADWAAWAGPPTDPALQSAALKAWREVVLPAFVARYGLEV